MILVTLYVLGSLCLIKKTFRDAAILMTKWAVLNIIQAKELLILAF